MKRAHLSPLSARRPRAVQPSRATAAVPPRRTRSVDTPKSFATARAARSAYVNAFCAFLHSPSQ